jgi:hypothetical protein
LEKERAATSPANGLGAVRLLSIRRLTEYAITYFHSFGNKSASQSSLFISGAQINETGLKERLKGSDRLSGQQQASGSNRAEQG